MKHSPSQFEESLEQLLQAVPIPERTDHTAELRTRVLNDYRERQARHAEPKSSFMKLSLTRIFFTTSGAVAILVLGFVFYNQSIQQDGIAQLPVNINNTAPQNSIIAQLSPKEVLAKSVEQTFNASETTSRFIQVRQYETPDDSDFGSEERAWVKGRNVRSDIYSNNGIEPTLPESAMVIYSDDGSVISCSLQVGFSCERLDNSADIISQFSDGNGLSIVYFLQAEYQTAIQNGEVIESQTKTINGVEQLVVRYRYLVPGLDALQESIFTLDPETYQVLRIEELPNEARLMSKTRVTEILEARELTAEEAATVFTIDHWEKTILDYYRSVLKIETPPTLLRVGL